MKDVYYTPKIEAFHQGFEFEVMEYDGSWEPEDDISMLGNIDSSLISDIEDLIFYKRVRVKYLSIEDIKGLGFKQQNSLTNERCVIYEKDDFVVCFFGYFNTVGVDLNLFVRVSKRNRIVFEGDVKNISELKRVLKQTDI